MNSSKTSRQDNTDSKNTPPEHHSFQFQGVFLPAARLYDILDGIITPLDAILLALIESLSSETESCYASSAYLADSLKVTPGHIDNAIFKLKNLGFLKTKRGMRGKIYTRWLTALHPKRARGISSIDEKGGGDLIKRLDPISSNDENPPHQTIRSIEEEKAEEEKEEKEKPLRGADRSVASLPPAACFGGVSSHIQGIENAKQESVASLPPPANKVTSNNDITKDETKNAIEDLMPQGSEQKLTKASSAERRLATQLYEGLQSQRHIKVRPDLNKWTLIFKKLIPLVMGGVAEIEKVIKLHVQSLSDPYHIRAYCAESFCRRYNDLANKLLNVEVKAEESAEQPKNAKERYLCEEITQLDWRHGSIDVIQTAALRSYRFLCDFVNQLEEFNKTPKAQRFKWLLDELIYNYAHLPEPVIHYYTRFCRFTNKYRSYKSAVPVLSVNHKDLPTTLADLIEEFDLSLWNRMMEAFKGD